MHRIALATISSALLLAGAAATSPGASADTAVPAPTAAPAVLLVDDDRQQCPGATFHSVQAAIMEAPAGAVVQVCPGVYTEFVDIDKPLTLLGQPEVVDALDCFDPTPSHPDDLDPTRYVVLERPQIAPEDREGNLVTVAAEGVTVAGLVLQGATSPAGAPNPVDAAVNLESGSAGAWVHHNLFRLNSLGIDLGSDGSATTRVDHNCLRGDLPSEPIRGTWGMASQRQDFLGGIVDHNETFGHTNFAFGVGDTASTRQSVFASNVSRQDDIGFTVNDSSNVSIADNDVHPKRFGVLFIGGNESIDVTDNRIEGGRFLGVLFQASGLPSKDVVVSDNKIANFARVLPTDPAFAIGLATNSLRQAGVQGVEIRDNVLRNNLVGLSVQPNNSGIVVRDNKVTGNAQQGIFSRAGVVGALYQDNRILGNGLDARDDNRAANTWIDNVCQTEQTIPIGATICGGD